MARACHADPLHRDKCAEVMAYATRTFGLRESDGLEKHCIEADVGDGAQRVVSDQAAI